MANLPDQLHERLLVLRCQTGDQQALVELVARYQPRLSYYVWKMLGQSDRVDDVLQDTWFDVIRGLPKLQDAAAFGAWAYRIARDRTYRELRRNGRGDLRLGDEEPMQPVADDGEFTEQDVALVHECLGELTPEHREVLVLRFLEGMSYEAVAEVARCEVGTVRSRLHYAKRALRRAIERKRGNHE